MIIPSKIALSQLILKAEFYPLQISLEAKETNFSYYKIRQYLFNNDEYDCITQGINIRKRFTYKSPILIAPNKTTKVYFTATLNNYQSPKNEGECSWSSTQYKPTDKAELIIQRKDKINNIGIKVDKEELNFLQPLSFSPDSEYLIFDKIIDAPEPDSHFVIFSLEQKQGFSIPSNCVFSNFKGFISPSEAVFECLYPINENNIAEDNNIFYIFDLKTKKLTSQNKLRKDKFKFYGTFEGDYQIINSTLYTSF